MDSHILSCDTCKTGSVTQPFHLGSSARLHQTERLENNCGDQKGTTSNMYAPTVKVSTAMTKSKRDVVNKAFEQAAFEVEREKERTNKEAIHTYDEGTVRYWVMRLGAT
jgi:hypothetical protein